MSVTSSHWNPSRECAKTRRTMQLDERWWRWPSRGHRRSTGASTAMLAIGCVALWFTAMACGEPPPVTRTGLVGGRVLMAPGAGLAGAHVQVDQVNLYDGKGEIRKHVGEAVSNEQGDFPPVPTGTVNGLILIETSGGTFIDPVTK